MAQIKGITLKRLTRFVGREGVAYQGSIYLNGKKVGWFSQSGDGGFSDFSFQSREIRDEVEGIVKKYYEEYPPDKYGGDIEDFFNTLVELILNEKEFKKGVKEGYPWFLTADNTFETYMEAKGAVPLPKAFNLPQKLSCDKGVEQFTAKLRAEGYNQITVYKTLDDFIIK